MNLHTMMRSKAIQFNNLPNANQRLGNIHCNSLTIVVSSDHWRVHRTK